jgi:hypothetical protein
MIITLLLIYTIYSHSTLIFSVCLHSSSWIYNTGTIKVSLNHTLPISLCCSTHKVFTSHMKSSQADFCYSSSTTNSRDYLLPRTDSSLSRRNYVTYIVEEQTCITETHVMRPPPTAVWCHRGHGKHSLFYSCMLDHVYRPVASQCVDQNC